MRVCKHNSFIQCPNGEKCSNCRYSEDGFMSFRGQLRKAIGPLTDQKREAIRTYIQQHSQNTTP